MKKMTIFIGSPRKQGNTVQLSKWLLEHIGEDIHAADPVFLYDYDIKPCGECRSCKEEEKLCLFDDDMKKIYPMIDSSEIIVFGTPIYWSGPTGMTKLMLDRLRPYYANQKLTGKKAALLLPAGEGASDCDLTIEMFQRAFNSLGMIFLGAATSKAYDEGDSAKDMDALEAVKELAAEF